MTIWLSGSVFLGWALGANDAANVFGTAVATRTVRFSTAAALICVFVVLGALLGGAGGMRTLGGLTDQTIQTAFITSFAAALTVTFMTTLSLPVSTSQAVVGAIMGIGLGVGKVDFGGLAKVIVCWVGTPIGAMLASIALYYLLSFPFNLISHNMFMANLILRWGFIIGGAWGAYALGANNVANVTGVFAGCGVMSPDAAALVGSLSICLGVVTYSMRVMLTVGQRLVALEPFTALVAVLSEALTVHFYAVVGVPVSTSQAIVGAVLGVGLLKGVKTVNVRVLVRILMGWLLTPAVSMLISCLLFLIFRSFA
ncbi:MAG: inorganic phosphate transporter [bacterium]